MTDPDWNELRALLGKMYLESEGATTTAIAKAQQCLGVEFPPDYIDFLTRSNGAVGETGDAYLHLFPVEEVVEGTRLSWSPGFPKFFVLIGTDGGGEGYVLDKRTSPPRIFGTELASGDPKDDRYVGTTLRDLLKYVREAW